MEKVSPRRAAYKSAGKGKRGTSGRVQIASAGKKPPGVLVEKPRASAANAGGAVNRLKYDRRPIRALIVDDIITLAGYFIPAEAHAGIASGAGGTVNSGRWPFSICSLIQFHSSS